MSFTLLEDDARNNNGQAQFTVFGVGGGGSNAVQNMVDQQIAGVKFVCANTDKQALDRTNVSNKIQLGEKSTRGLGAGARPEVGRAAAEETRDQIREQLEGADMVFVTAGMGGGTGTGAAPVIAEIAKEMGILTVGVVTTPFRFEGRKRQKSADQGIAQLEEFVDSLIVVPNERLLEVYGDVSVADAYKKADDVLLNAVRSIFDLIVNPGYINMDFADLKTVMSTRGYAMMGTGFGRGEHRAQQAADMAVRSPLLDNLNLHDAKSIMLNIAGSEDLSLKETQAVVDSIERIIDEEEVEIFYGTVIDPSLKDEIRVTVVATGLTRNNEPKQTIQAHTPAPAQQPQVAATFTRPFNAPQQAAPTATADAVENNTVEPTATTPARPAPANRPSPMSIQEYLKNQQGKQ
ncbi:MULTISPECIES: cell division protein FtsZ [unclassified Acinetobacter]|uniref:cell division protein FtsZ n=1 Tax=unclassified Acinetobacter TaxID=196816 RepID=UPI0035B85758